MVVIPVHLKLAGFLSYRAPAEIDFSSFDLACISGANGAGKSSLLDAITWALFGQARKRDDSLVNLQSQIAEVSFTFLYEGNTYRVIRRLPRGKNALLEFQILDEGQGDNEAPTAHNPPGRWRPLTERTLRETQERIEQILRLDYDTFVNAAFFLQGKADQFAQQPPARRKEILSSILGLEVWEEYRQRASERRKENEEKLAALQGRINDIDAELAEEAERRRRLAELEERLQRLRDQRQAQEAALENVRQIVNALAQQRDRVQQLETALEHARDKQRAWQERLHARQKERADYDQILARAAEIESRYTAWQQARQAVEQWQQMTEQYHRWEERRQPHLRAIASEQARLEQEKALLESQAAEINGQQEMARQIQSELTAAAQALAALEEALAQRGAWETQKQALQQKQAELRHENERLKAEMEELKARIDQLAGVEGAACPLCGQPLMPTERASLIERLQSEGAAKGTAWRANKATLEDLDSQIHQLQSQLESLAPLEQEQRERHSRIAQLTERLEATQRQIAEWETSGAPRLQEVTRRLAQEDFAAEARQALAEIQRELTALGYDAQAYEAALQNERALRSAEEEYHHLEQARAATKPLDEEIASLQEALTELETEITRQQGEYETARQTLAEAEAKAPDVEAAERALLDVQEQENRLNQEIGAARQRVAVLDELRLRKQSLEAERQEQTHLIRHYKTLERAFGKDGVPALLIEQALPEIEARANELLDRLSDGQMSVRFLTQTAYKDKSRADLRETLEIQISDGAGVRPYELYSGGEAFRVNFAIRVALAEVLTHRKGARLQTLVIDEGFGSQDAQGRQRLIEAINSIRADFAKILVITHLEDLKDAFPARIEVEKTADGSRVCLL